MNIDSEKGAAGTQYINLTNESWTDVKHGSHLLVVLARSSVRLKERLNLNFTMPLLKPLAST